MPMLRIACCDTAPNPCSCEEPWFELYSRRHRPGAGFPNGRALGWKRTPAPRWGRWRGLALDRSRRKRWATWAQPEPRWRHPDGRAADAARFETNFQRLLLKHTHIVRTKRAY